MRPKGRESLRWRLVLVAVFQVGLVAGFASTAAAQPVQPGDLFVGAGINIGSGLKGVIHRVRGASVDRFCESTSNPFADHFFGVPHEVVVDSWGRVVFLAGMIGHQGLFRCDSLGAVPELLGLFPAWGTVPPGAPVPFPNDYFYGTNGLHLARVKAVRVDDAVNNGLPRILTEEAYVFLASRRDPSGRRLATKTVRYRLTSGIWDEGPQQPDPLGDLADAVNHAGHTYMATLGVLRRQKDPLRLEMSGRVGGDEFRLSTDLFGGFKEVRGIIIDDSEIPNNPSGCPPSPDTRIRDHMPGPIFNPLISMTNVAFDGHGSFGLVLTSNDGGLPPYLTNVSEAWLNDDPEDDAFFKGRNGCSAEPVLDYTSIVPSHWDPTTGEPNGVNVLATAPGGLVGTQRDTGRVVRVTPGERVTPIVTGLIQPFGIAAASGTGVPAASGLALVIRIDAQVNALVTDPFGRRIGVDPNTGETLNEFAENGFDSGPGAARVYAIQNPAPGGWSVASAGGAGLTVRVQCADASRRNGTTHDLTFGPDGTVGFDMPGVCRPVVRVVYLVPLDRPFNSTYRARIQAAIENVQRWYRGEMEALGVRKGFTLHTPVVEFALTPHAASWYATTPNGDDFRYWFHNNVYDDAFALTGGREEDPANIWVFYIDAEPGCIINDQGEEVEQIGGAGARGVAHLWSNDLRGLAGETNTTHPCPGRTPDNRPVDGWIGGLGHELGHALGLPHPAGCDPPRDPATCGDHELNSLMYLGYLNYPQTYLLVPDVNQLDASPFFTADGGALSQQEAALAARRERLRTLR